MSASDPRSLPHRLCGGLSDAMSAGALVGAVETARLLWGSDRELPGAAGIAQIAVTVIGLSIGLAALIGALLLLLAAGVARLDWYRAWWAGAREPGPGRVVALVRALFALVALGGIGGAAYALALATYRRFNAAGPVGVLHAVATVAAVVAIATIASACSQWLAKPAARAGWLVRATTGWAGYVSLALATAGATIGTIALVGRAAPAYDQRPALTAAGFVAALIALRWFGLARRAGRSTLRLGGLVGAQLAWALAALVVIGSWADARQVIAANGISSGTTLRALWRLSDRDGDGYPAHFGGADCDDGNRAIHPGAQEVLDNGIDENCNGRDLVAADFGPRAAVQPTHYPGAPRKNVILISIDAARADRMSVYGHSRPTTPRLQALAADATRFEWAISPAPTTRRAIPGLVTGRYASTLAMLESDKHWPPTLVKGRHALLGQSFDRAGYDTQAIMCCTTLFDKASGVAIGFDKVDASAVAKYRQTYYNGDELAQKGRDFLLGRKPDGRPFFLWMHFIDPHNPYKQLPGAPDFGGQEIDRYDSEIAFVDTQIGVLLDTLAEAGLAEHTILAITADHGDEFKEHGGEHHARTLYNEVVRVPLIVKDPGSPGRVVSAPVSMLDIGPTLLDLVGLDTPKGVNGQSLAKAVRDGAPVPDRPILCEVIRDRNVDRNLKGAFFGPWKIIFDLDANTYELYSLTDDPGDTTNAASARPQVLSEMKVALHDAIDRELTLLPGEQVDRVDTRDRARSAADAGERVPPAPSPRR